MWGWGGGNIVFSEDPIGVASCLQSISLMNGWILAKLTQIYHWVKEKCWLDFDDHDPIFKVTQGQIVGKGWKIACLHPISWTNKWILTVPAYLNCWDMLNNWLDFNDLDPIFKVTWWLRWYENGLSAPCLLDEWMEFYTLPHNSGRVLWFHVGRPFVRLPISPSYVRLSIFRFRMITWVNFSGFSPNLVCALILWRSGLGWLMGKFCQIFMELPAKDTPIFLFPGYNLSK